MYRANYIRIQWLWLSEIYQNQLTLILLFQLLHGRVSKAQMLKAQVISLDLLRCCGLSAVGQLALCTRLWASVRELLPKALVVALHRLNSSYWWNNLELSSPVKEQMIWIYSNSKLHCFPSKSLRLRCFGTWCIIEANDAISCLDAAWQVAESFRRGVSFGKWWDQIYIFWYVTPRY